MDSPFKKVKRKQENGLDMMIFYFPLKIFHRKVTITLTPTGIFLGGGRGPPEKGLYGGSPRRGSAGGAPRRRRRFQNCFIKCNEKFPIFRQIINF